MQLDQRLSIISSVVRFGSFLTVDEPVVDGADLAVFDKCLVQSLREHLDCPVDKRFHFLHTAHCIMLLYRFDLCGVELIASSTEHIRDDLLSSFEVVDAVECSLSRTHVSNYPTNLTIAWGCQSP